MADVVIANRFRGPRTSGNGGYSCGMVAQFIEGPAQVTLRTPPPLDRALEVREDDGGVALFDGDQLVAEGRPAAGDFDVPEPVGVEEARAAAQNYEWFHEHPYPECFVCGPRRDEGDGLRIFPSPVEGRGIYAAPWTPDPELTGP